MKVRANPDQADSNNNGIGDACEAIQVSVDIKPGSDPNCFNQNEHGVIPVAILGSDDLSVADIDVATLSVQGLAVRIQGKSDRYQSHYEYVNEDEFIDLVCQFEDSDNWVTPGSDYATVTGNLLDGTNIEGQDTICIVPE
jgi:hypothetical protein